MPQTTETPQATFAIIDDHRAVADIMGYALETRLPIKCIARFNTIEAAKAKLVELKPRIVITDWRLGDDTSAQLVREFSPQLRSTRWLLFTAWPTNAVLKESVSAGIHGCVSKSADYEELSHAVEELLEGGNYFCDESMQGLGQGRTEPTLPVGLTPTERSILKFVADGLEAKEISSKVELSTKTVHNYLVTIRSKLKLGSMVDLANYAIREGIARQR